jgi:hypothetical protein
VALILLIEIAAHNLFPLRCVRFSKERKFLEMRVLKQLLFAVAVMICFSITASAQRQDEKKNPPPKKTPPVIVVPPKNDDKNKPKDDRNNDNRNDNKKKPEGFYLDTSGEAGISSV